MLIERIFVSRKVKFQYVNMLVILAICLYDMKYIGADNFNQIGSSFDYYEEISTNSTYDEKQNRAVFEYNQLVVGDSNYNEINNAKKKYKNDYYKLSIPQNIHFENINASSGVENRTGTFKIILDKSSVSSTKKNLQIKVKGSGESNKLQIINNVNGTALDFSMKAEFLGRFSGRGTGNNLESGCEIGEDGAELCVYKKINKVSTEATVTITIDKPILSGNYSGVITFIVGYI